MEPPSASPRAGASWFRPSVKMWLYLALVAVMYASALWFVHRQGLSFRAMFQYGLLQEPGLTGDEARLAEIETPLSWNLMEVLGYVYIKSAAVLVELFQYWAVGMLIAGALTVFVSWEWVKAKMGDGGLKANALAAGSGAVIPICSCGIVPVLAGMVEAGVPLGPTMAFLIAAPMLNVPTVIMTAGLLGWPMAIGRIVATFAIALTVGSVLSRWQRKHRNPRKFLKIFVPPRLSAEHQRFAFQFGMKAASAPEGLTAAELGTEAEKQLLALEEAGIAEQTRDGRWTLSATDAGKGKIKDVGACAILPTGEAANLSFAAKLRETFSTGLRLFMQLNGYLLLAVWMAGAIKVLLPTAVVTSWVGGSGMVSVLLAAGVATLAYVCTYVEVPTAMALMGKGMGGGATLAYLLGGPGLSIPSIAMLSGVFKLPVLALYVGVSFVGCVVAGLVFNLLF